MNGYEKFLELPNEKQLRIINAGFEYFGKYGYKGANTEDIASRAEISKGLLFYYFKNKESYYLFLCEFQSFIFSRGVFLAWTYAQSEIVAEIP